MTTPPPAPELPADLPEPVDDGAASHLLGVRLPHVALASTRGGEVRLDEVAGGRWILFVYPLTGDPEVDVPQGWDAIPGARGCSQEACSFRDFHQALLSAGAEAVLALSTERIGYQRDLAERLHLPYALVSDPDAALADAIGLPTFQASGMPDDYGRLMYRRLTLVVRGARVEHVFYPVFPPGDHAAEVLAWLESAG